MPQGLLGTLWAQGQAAARFWRERRWLRLAVNLGLGAGLVVVLSWLFWSDLQRVLAEDISFSLPHLAGAVGLYGLNLAPFIVVWRNIVERLGGPPGWRHNAVRYANTSITRFLPTPAWFLVSRVHVYAQDGLGRRAALAMTALETLLHMYTGAAFFGMLAFEPARPLTWLYLLLLAPAAAVLVQPHWLNLRWMSGARPMPGVRRRDILLWLSLYALTWVIAGPFLGWTIRAFSTVPQLPMPELWRIWALSSVVAYLSAYTLGGLGVLREFALTWLLARFYPAPVALLIALVVRLVLTGAGVGWGLGLSALLSLAWKKQLAVETAAAPVEAKEQV